MYIYKIGPGAETNLAMHVVGWWGEEREGGVGGVPWWGWKEEVQCSASVVVSRREQLQRPLPRGQSWLLHLTRRGSPAPCQLGRCARFSSTIAIVRLLCGISEP